MEIRLLKANELRAASSIALEAYREETLSQVKGQEEIEAFERYVDEDHLWVEMCRNKLFLWGAFENGQMCAVGAIESNGEVTMLYVNRFYRNRGIETDLLQEMAQFAIYARSLRPEEVKIPQKWQQFRVEAKQPYGMPEQTYNEGQNVAGRKNSKTRTWLIILGVIAAVLLVVGLVWLGVESIFGYWKEQDTPSYARHFSVPMPRLEDENTEEWQTEENEEWEEKELSDALGRDFLIPEEEIFAADDLEYTVSMQSIEISEDEENGFMEFNVDYPQITYADGRDASAINQILRDGACVQVDYMYPETNPDALIMDEDYPYLASYVKYEITYMSNDLLCVAYEDHYFAGSIYAEYGDLRTRVINLSDGSCYEIEGILNHDTELGAAYYDKLCAENDSFMDAPAFDAQKAERTIAGETVDGRFFSNFIICKSGIKINLTYHYGDGNLIMRGWISTDWTSEELTDYRTDSTIWEKL